MIYIKDIGGRLGNQLFQIAAGYNVAKHMNDTLCVPPWKYIKYFNGPFHIGEDGSSFCFHEPHFHYRPISHCKNLSIKGYFQSYKYFQSTESDIRKMFSLNQNSEIVEEVNMLAEQIASSGPSCSIHIRRGDYLNYPNHHPTLSAEWYKAAMSRFPKDTAFWVFGDDIGWCKEYIQGPNVYHQHSSDIVDFFSMSLCNHHVIANSSFSWWAAWLNPSMTKKVIYPSRWFGPALATWDTKDLCPPEWIRL